MNTDDDEMIVRRARWVAEGAELFPSTYTEQERDLVELIVHGDNGDPQ